MLKRQEHWYAAAQNVKPRIIWNPPDKAKILLGTLNYNMLKIVKSVTPEIVCGLTPEELNERL